MKNTHIIQKQIFKIKIGDQKKFKEVCQIIEGLFKNELGAHIEEVLDQYNIKDQDIVIDRLDIDLGKLDTRNLKNSIKSAFISSFQRMLEDKIKNFPEQIRIVDRQTRNKTVFDFFIKNGNTPWWVSTRSGNLKKEFTRFFYTRSYQTKSIWQQALKNPVQYKRLLFNLDLEMLIARWVSIQGSNFKVPQQSMVKAILEIVARQGVIIGNDVVTARIKSNIIDALFSSAKSVRRKKGVTESIRDILEDSYGDRYGIEKMIREIVKPASTPPKADIKIIDIQKQSDEVISAYYDNEFGEEFVHFLQHGYTLNRNIKGGFNSITSIFDYLVRTDVGQLAILLRYHARNPRIRQRFLNQVSQESISAFFIKIAPDKKELFQWINELYLPAEEVLKPINQTNIRVQKSVNEVTLEIFIQQNLNNLNSEAFMRMHFKRMALRYNIRYTELLKIVVKITKARKNKKSGETKFVAIIEQLYENAPGKKTSPDQELEDDEDWELVINQEKKEIPEQLLNQIPRDVIKELMHVKNSGILGKSSVAIQQLISAYIRYVDKSKKTSIDDPKVLIKSIAEFLEIDKGFLEFGLMFSAKLQRENNLFVSQEHLLYDHISSSPIVSKFSTRDELGMIVKHFIRYRNSYELSHLKKIFDKKILFEKIDKKIFRQFMELIFGDQHKKIADYILSIAIVEDIDARQRIEKQVYATFVQETLSAGTGDFNISKVFSKLKILLKGYITDPIEIPKSILSISSSFTEKIKKRKSRKKSSKAAYIKEKNILTLYHILDLDLVLDNVGNNFFDNIIFSFDLLLTKHRQEFIEVLFQNRFNKELAYFLTYQDEAALLQQIEKIFSTSKVERIHKALESAINLIGKLNWLKMTKDEVSKYATLFIYPTLFSNSNERISFHEFIYTILETAEKEKTLSNDFYMLFEQKSEKQIRIKIEEILEKDLLPKELIEDSDDTVSMLKIGEFDALAKKNTDDPNNSYYYELISGVLENLRFPEGHAFYGQSWNENREYINRIFKKSPIVLDKIQSKGLSISQQEVLLDILDADLIRQAISNVYKTSLSSLNEIINFWIKKGMLKSGFDEKEFLKTLLRKSTFTKKTIKDLHKNSTSVLLEEKIISPWDLLEIIYDPKSVLNIVEDNLKVETILKNVPVDSNTWIDSYFKILSSPNFGNPKAYKVVNSWIRFMFSAPMHKTQKQAFIFIFTVYFKFSFWKIKIQADLHEILINQSEVLKVNDSNNLVLFLKAMVVSGIPVKSILNAATNTSGVDINFITNALANLAKENISESDKIQAKPIKSGILTPEQFTNTLLFEDSRDEKAASLFQVWIGEKKWSDTELSGLFKILALPVLLREIYLMTRYVDMKKVIETWLEPLDKMQLYRDKNKRYYALISVILKQGLWKYKSEDLIHANFIRSLAIFNKKDRADIFKFLTILTEAKIPLVNLPKLKGLGLGSQGEDIKSLIEQYVFALTDPRLFENADETKEVDETVIKDQIEEDLNFFIQSGNLFLQEGEMTEREKLIVSRIKEIGISNFLSNEDLNPESIDQLLIIFSKEDTKEYLLSSIGSLLKDDTSVSFFNDVFNDFFEQADNESIIKIIKQFNDIGKMRTLSAESRLGLLIREISKVRRMEKSISKTFLIYKNEDLKNINLPKNFIKESNDKEDSIVTDIEKIFIYFLEYGLIMPGAFVSSLQEVRSTLLTHMKTNPNAVRYLLHIKGGIQKSRKRIVQLMRTGMSSEILSIIHPNLKKELNSFEQLMKNNFNINIWEVLRIDNDSSKWDHILLLWSGMNSRVKDPIEIIELLLKSILKNIDNALLRQIQKFDSKRFSASEKTFWKGLTALIPELKQIPADQKRKLKSPDDIKDTAEQKEREEEMLDPEEGITVYNAGLVLLWPFLARYFSMLELANSKDFLGDAERARAIQLTQYLVTGKTEMEEWNLSLNKILCGADLNFPIEPTLDITLEEEGLSEKMLKGALQNWPKLKNTKSDTFQETFLRREGRLYKRDNRWELIVEKKAYDMLLSSLPWNISMIKLNWMTDRLVVEWN